MSVISLTRLQASSGKWVSVGLRSRRSLPPSLWVPRPVLRPTILSLFLVLLVLWCLSLFCPHTPLPSPCRTVLVPIPTPPTGEYFRGRPARPLPVGSPWPRTRWPPNRCQGPVPYPPSPVLCHSRSPPHLALNRHWAVVLWSVPPLRHGRGHSPSLPWLLTTGALY